MDSNLLEALSHCVIFDGLDNDRILNASRELDGRVIEVSSHSSYYLTGQKINRVAIVLNGTMRASLIDPEGRENLVAKFKKGYLCAFDIACTGTGISPYDIYTVEGATIFEFEFDKLKSPGFLSPDIREKMLWNLILYLSNNNIRSQYKIEVLSCLTIRDKVMNYLVTRARKMNSMEFNIPFNREEMANYLCVNRSALSHELSLMKQEGIIDFKKNHFVINIVHDYSS